MMKEVGSGIRPAPTSVVGTKLNSLGLFMECWTTWKARREAEVEGGGEGGGEVGQTVGDEMDAAKAGASNSRV
jgi:hypothetical protein